MTRSIGKWTCLEQCLPALDNVKYKYLCFYCLFLFVFVFLNVCVVYLFHCGEDGWSVSYFGCTGNVLSECIKQRRYSDSSIYKHFTVDNYKLPPICDNFEEMFEIKNRSNEKHRNEICWSYFDQRQLDFK